MKRKAGSQDTSTAARGQEQQSDREREARGTSRSCYCNRASKLTRSISSSLCTTEIEIEGRLIEQLMKAALQRKWESIGRHALPVLSAAPSGLAAYDRLLQAIGDAPVVMVHSHLD